MTAVTLIRAAVPQTGAATYVAVHTADALGVLAYLGSAFAEVAGPEFAGLDLDANTLPWEALPGIRPLAAGELAGRPPRTVLFVGTAVDGVWTRWHPHCPPPAVPA